MRTVTVAISAAAIAGAMLLGASPAYADGVALIPVTPLGVEHDDPCGTMNDGFFLPEEEEGVLEYKFEGGLNGADITVTAILAEGYVLAEGALGVWQFPQMTNVPCAAAPAPVDPAAPAGPATPAVPAATSTPVAALAKTGFESGTIAVTAAAALLAGGALIGGRAIARRRATK